MGVGGPCRTRQVRGERSSERLGQGSARSTRGPRWPELAPRRASRLAGFVGGQTFGGRYEVDYLGTQVPPSLLLWLPSRSAAPEEHESPQGGSSVGAHHQLPPLILPPGAGFPGPPWTLRFVLRVARARPKAGRVDPGVSCPWPITAAAGGARMPVRRVQECRRAGDACLVVWLSGWSVCPRHFSGCCFIVFTT